MPSPDIMNVTLIVPSQYVGDTISSLTQRGGIVSSMESKTAADHINAEAPLAQLFGYSTALRSSTQGRGTFSMEFSHYAPKCNDLNSMSTKGGWSPKYT